MEQKIHNSQTKEAKVLKLYPETQSTETHGLFSCPAVNLINHLSTEIKVLKQLVTKRSDNPKERLDNSELLREYKICRSTASNWRNTGLSYTKIGSKFYYTRENIELFMEKRNVKGF